MWAELTNRIQELISNYSGVYAYLERVHTPTCGLTKWPYAKCDCVGHFQIIVTEKPRD